MSGKRAAKDRGLRKNSGWDADEKKEKAKQERWDADEKKAKQERKSKAFSIAMHVTGNVVALRRGDTEWIWDPDRHLDRNASTRGGPGEPERGFLSSFTVADGCNDDGSDMFFIFYVQDSAWPAQHGIQARSWEDAYEEFIEMEAERGHYVIEDGDPDYDEDAGSYTSSGVRVDTESFMGDEVDFAWIENVED